MAQKSDRERETLKYGFMERIKTGEGMGGRGLTLTNKKLPVLNIPGDEWEI